MSRDEVGYLSKSYMQAYRERWDMLRHQKHAVYHAQGAKNLDLTDVMKFPWDDEHSSETESLQSAEAVAEAKERIKKRYNL